MQNSDIKEIKILYANGSEKVLDRGVCFSVSEKEGILTVGLEGTAGTTEDELAVLAIISKVARKLGIDEELENLAKEVEGCDET